MPIKEKENLVVTVGGGGNFIKEAKRKRLDYFINLGEEFNLRYPEYKAEFLAVGHNKDTPVYEFLNNLIKANNVKLIPNTRSIEELVSFYERSSVYMQLSFYEAFGIAQAEAMLYGCIPLSNPGGAISEVIGNTGFTVANYDIEEYIKILKEIFDRKHENLREKAKLRVLNLFSLNARKTELLNFLRSI
jgi:glycosyltransferase involved in cell wall biosynthesis